MNDIPHKRILSLKKAIIYFVIFTVVIIGAAFSIWSNKKTYSKKNISKT